MHLTDDSILSVLAYAIAELGVEHVVVVGHTQCGGAAACLAAASAPPPPSSAPKSPLQNWLGPLTSLAQSLKEPTAEELVDENVKEQVRNVLATDVVKAAWSKDPEVRGNAKLVGVHGWVYEIERGRVKDLEVTVYAP